MINRTTIRSLCNATVYKRGLDIYHSDDKIYKFSVHSDNKFETVDASVKGSGRKSYCVKIKYDKTRNSLNSIFCECPAFESYSGICKHCAAVLMEYIDYHSRKQVIEDYARKSVAKNAENFLDQLGGRKSLSDYGIYPDEPENTRKTASRSGIINWKTVPEKPTTSAMKLLLNKKYLSRTSPIQYGDSFGKIRVLPIIRYSGKNIQAEFQMGVTRMYVLKDVFEFVWNMKEGREVSYGQKLKFVHIPEAFEEGSRGIVQFILNWTARNGNRYIQQSYHFGAYSGSHPRLRSLPLTGAELEELLDSIQGQEFTAQIGNQGEQKWKITSGKPERRLEICGDSNGVQLTLEPIYNVNGMKHRIYFLDGKVFMVLKADSQAEDFIDCMEQLPDNQAFIQKEDMPTFGRELLPLLEKQFQCEKKNFQEEDYGIFPVHYEIYLDAPQKNWITCKALAVYGDKKYSVFEKETDRNLRDMAGETILSAMLSQYFNAYDQEKKELALSEDEEKLYHLMKEGILHMQDTAEVYVSDALKRIRIVGSPKVRIGVSLSAGLLDLDISAEGMDKDELMEILSRYNRKKKYYRLKNGSFLNMEDEQIEALLDLKDGLHITSRQLRQETIEVPAYRALYLDSRLKENASLVSVKDKKFRALIRNMQTAQDSDFEVPTEQNPILREYQKQGYLWMKTLCQNGFGGILADDMGLGKTLQVITFLWSEYLEISNRSDEEKGNHPSDWLCLIVTPASLVYNWASEIQRFAPGLPAIAVAGTAAERDRILEAPGGRMVLITSYELLRRDIEKYEKLHFACQIIDEAQYIKNHGTQAAKAVKRVPAEFKMALTGTPVENRLSELWSIFDYLMPGFLYSYEQFRKELETPVVQNEDEKVRERLQRMIRPFVLRRLKRDVLKELPDKLEKNMFARMEGEQQSLYDAHVKRLQMTLGKQTEAEFKMSRIQILSEITKLRQICCHPGLLYEDYKGESAKMSMCLELIKNAVNGGHKILLFSQFTTMLGLLKEQLEREHISCYALTGATSKEKRKELVEAFNSDDTSVFCISLKAGGTGLNLTAADIVIHYDPWWNLAVQNQATDRAHRIGQKNVVSVYRLFARGTIEEKIKALQEQKMELADQILSGEGLDSGHMSREDMMELLTM